MNLNIDNKIALVTGAGRGLGKGICKSLSDEGVIIIAVSRGQDGLDQLENDLSKSKRNHFIQCDLEEESSVKNLISILKKR